MTKIGSLTPEGVRTSVLGEGRGGGVDVGTLLSSLHGRREDA
jgi:hypothetical protein